MNKNDKLSIILAVALLGLCILYGRQCQKAKTTKTEIQYMDSSATKQLTEKNLLADRLTDIYRAKELKWIDSLEKLNKGLKTVKVVFKEKYIYLKSNPTEITDSNCMLTLEYANGTINYYDSVYTLQSKILEDCFKQNGNLDAQVKINKQFAELALKDKGELIRENLSFKHIIWRLYRKRK